MKSKNKMISDYIIEIANKVNEQYQGLITKEKVLKAIEMFKDSPKEFEEIKKEIDELVKQAIEQYLAEQEKRHDSESVKKNHEEIYGRLEELTKKLNEEGVDYQLAGALCAFIKYGAESDRTHDDIDINLNEEDVEKFRAICEEMGLTFHDDRMITPRVLKNGIPAGNHELMATLDGSDFHIGAFCFERKKDGTIVNKGYYHDEEGNVCTRNEIIEPELAGEIFGREQVDFRGQKLTITPPEYVYRLKKFTGRSKDLEDIGFMEDKIDKSKLSKIESLSKSSSRVEYVPVTKNNSLGQNYNNTKPTYNSDKSSYVNSRPSPSLTNGHVRKLTRANNWNQSNKPNSSGGFADVMMLSFIVAFIIAMFLGIIYLLYGI